MDVYYDDYHYENYDEFGMDDMYMDYGPIDPYYYEPPIEEALYTVREQIDYS